MREDLYEQCSDHITEKTPSSTVFGSRPSSSFTRVNSSGVRLCAAMTSGVIDSIKSRQKAESRRQKDLSPRSAYCLLPTSLSIAVRNSAGLILPKYLKTSLPSRS